MFHGIGFLGSSQTRPTAWIRMEVPVESCVYFWYSFNKKANRFPRVRATLVGSLYEHLLFHPPVRKEFYKIFTALQRDDTKS
jgi:hypothetical protein